MDDKKLLKIRQAAYNKVYNLKGPETPTAVANAWLEAVLEQLANEGDEVVPASLRARMLTAYQKAPDDYLEALNAVSERAGKLPVLFTCKEHELALEMFAVNVGLKAYEVT